jgi:hypothetical protein
LLIYSKYANDSQCLNKNDDDDDGVKLIQMKLQEITQSLQRDEEGHRDLLQTAPVAQGRQQAGAQVAISKWAS